MGACVTRCLPHYLAHRYQPVRSRYLVQDDVVQDQPLSSTCLSSSSSDESLCMSDVLLLPADDDAVVVGGGGGGRAGDHSDVPPLSSSPPHLAPPTQSDVPLLLAVREVEGSSCTTVTPASTLLAQLPPHYYLNTQAEDEVELTAPQVDQQQQLQQQWEEEMYTRQQSSTFRVPIRGSGGERWWAPRGGLPGSLPSLTEGDSPPTCSLDLEWEPEAGMCRRGNSRDSVGGGEEASQTAESGSWVPRSSCSTPNSLEWDFRASTLSLRGEEEATTEGWHHTDMETEQLLHEIEQLAARALADTGHGLSAPAPSTPPR